MHKSELIKYIKNSEKKVSPAEVGKLHGRAEMLRKLPLGVQKFIVDRASTDDPYIGFIVEPYSFFLSYEIVDVAAAQAQLPPHYELIPCAMFDDTKPRFCTILGAFNIHSSVFWGNRVEFYIIAENKKTGKLTWIIADYESNTISYDPGRGFLGASTKHSVVTTSFQGEVIIDVEGAESNNRINLVADIKNGVQTPLTDRLWVEGNLSVDYGVELEDEGDSKPFGLIFDPREMTHALKIPLAQATIEQNSFGSGMVAKQPFEICCFPFAQHFLTTSFPTEALIQDPADLENAIIEFNKRMGEATP